MLALLMRHPWPGNVRELEDTVRVAAAAARGEAAIEPEHLPEWFFEEMSEGPRACAGAAREEESVDAVLRATRGNVEAAARRMGVCSKTVRRRIAASGLDLRAIRRAGAKSARAARHPNLAGGKVGGGSCGERAP